MVLATMKMYITEDSKEQVYSEECNSRLDLAIRLYYRVLERMLVAEEERLKMVLLSVSAVIFVCSQPREEGSRDGDTAAFMCAGVLQVLRC